jgi:hypothetical protein
MTSSCLNCGTPHPLRHFLMSHLFPTGEGCPKHSPDLDSAASTEGEGAHQGMANGNRFTGSFSCEVCRI